VTSEIHTRYVWNALLNSSITTFKIMRAADGYIAIEFFATRAEFELFAADVEPKTKRLLYAFQRSQGTYHLPVYRYTVIVEESMVPAYKWPLSFRVWQSTEDNDDQIPF